MASEGDESEDLAAQRPHLRTVHHERLMVILKAARDQILGLPHSCSPFEDEKVDRLSHTLKFLMHSAGAQWSHDFGKLFRRVHSINVCPTSRSAKQIHRQKAWKCDACGRDEHGCAYELNIAGSPHFDPDTWWKGLGASAGAWLRFNSDYTALSNATRFDRQDFGKLYIGKTCLRKAKLQFMIQTFVLELYYMTQQDILEHPPPLDSDADRDAAYTAAAHERMRAMADKMDATLSHIERAIAKEGVEPPPVEEDRTLWTRLKHLRTQHAAARRTTVDALLQQRTRTLLRDRPEDRSGSDGSDDELHSEGEERSDDEYDDSFIDDDEAEADDDFECDDEGPVPDAAGTSEQHARPGGNRKHAVVRESDSDEDEQPSNQHARPAGADQSRPGVTRKRSAVVIEEEEDDDEPTRVAERVTRPPQRLRRSRRVRQMDPGESSPSESAPAAAAAPQVARTGAASATGGRLRRRRRATALATARGRRRPVHARRRRRRGRWRATCAFPARPPPRHRRGSGAVARWSWT